MLKGLANEQQFIFMAEDQIWFGIRKVWTSFCIWLGSLRAFSCLNLFVAICGLFWHGLLMNMIVILLKSFMTPEKGTTPPFGDFPVGWRIKILNDGLLKRLAVVSQYIGGRGRDGELEASLD